MAIILADEDPMNILIGELREMRKLQEETRDELRAIRKNSAEFRNELENLRGTVTELTNNVENQQSFLEILDQRQRANNFVITGLPEGVPFDEKESDEEKIDLVLDKMGVKESAGPYTARRISNIAPDKIRPILVCVSSESTRNEVTKQASTLKRAGESYARIRVKKDTHPAVRREWMRLFDAAEAEKAKPENVGHSITVDKKNRQLMRDTVIIDNWKPSFF